MYVDKDAPEDKIVAALAARLSDVNEFAMFFREWASLKDPALASVEEHLLRAEDELRVSLSLMVHSPREEREK